MVYFFPSLDWMNQNSLDMSRAKQVNLSSWFLFMNPTVLRCGLALQGSSGHTKRSGPMARSRRTPRCWATASYTPAKTASPPTGGSSRWKLTNLSSLEENSWWWDIFSLSQKYRISVSRTIGHDVYDSRRECRGVRSNFSLHSFILKLGAMRKVLLLENPTTPRNIRPNLAQPL